MNYNLLTEDWIPVLYHKGDWKRVGIRKALEEAAQIRQIAASNPMDNVALLRFLLAVLQWCKPELTDGERERLAGAKGIPAEWLTKNLGTAQGPEGVFDLLGDGQRFYQDKSILDELLKAKQKKWDDRRKKAESRKAPKTPRPTSLDHDDFRPIGDLLVEFPTETKIAHSRHVRDKEYGLCPACCALGIIRFCGWANAYGGGRYTSTVNGPTPAYAIACDSTLLRTILVDWPTNGESKRKPPWLCSDPPGENDLDIVTVFAWRSRRFWLSEPGNRDEPCAYCGQVGTLIKQVAFTGNWKPPFESSGRAKKFWSQDPHLILVEKAQAAEDDVDTMKADDDTSTRQPRRETRGVVTQTTLGFPPPGAKVTAHTRFWRRALSARLAQSTATQTDTTSVTVTGPAANKGLYQDAASVRLPRDCRRETIGMVNNAVESLSGILRSSTPNPDRQHPERKAALDAFSPSLEARLRQELSVCQKPEDLRDLLQPTVRDAVSATTVGSPLRRRDAIRCAASALDAALWKVASNRQNAASTDDNSQANEPKAAKPKRRRRNREPGT